MERRRKPVFRLRCLLPLYALLLAGCANCRWPRIDPTGDHIFARESPVLSAGAPLTGPPVVSVPAATASVAPPTGLTVSPGQIAAPAVVPPQANASSPPPAIVGPPQVDVAVDGPDSAALGSNVTYTIRVTNRSNTPCTKLLVTDRFDSGLQHAASASSIERDLGDLPPGATRQIGVVFRLTQPGAQCQTVEVMGDRNLRATIRKCTTGLAPVGAAPPPAAAIGPKSTGATVTINKTGPERRQVGEVASFEIVVTNNSDRAMTNVRIEDNYEPTLEPTEATEGWELSGGALVWKIASVDAAKSVRRQVNCRCLREATRACNRVTVTADGLTAIADEACLQIVSTEPTRQPAAQVEQPPSTAAGSLAVAVADTVDPIGIGDQESYSIVVTNNSDASDKQVQLTVTIPSETTLTNFGGPVRGTPSPGSIKFLPIAELRAGERVTFEVSVRAAKPGTARLRANVTSQRQRAAVSSEATTQILER